MAIIPKKRLVYFETDGIIIQTQKFPEEIAFDADGCQGIHAVFKKVN